MTNGSTWTAASKSCRKRHKGAASKRLMQAKEAESHAGAKAKGWLGSIRDAASNRNQIWDPDEGWVDYTEPDKSYGQNDFKPIGSLYLSEKIISGRAPAIAEEPENYEESKDDLPKSVDFPVEWAKERETMIKSDQSTKRLKSAVYTDGGEMKSLHDDDSIFSSDAMTVNTALEVSSLMSNSTAPTRRASPKHRPSDKRKIVAVQSKPIGWKETMEAVTAIMNDGARHWDYENGWVEDYGSADDVSELTRLTSLERSPESKIDYSPVESLSPSYHLPSVAEEVFENDSHPQADDDDKSETDERKEEENGVSKHKTEDGSQNASPKDIEEPSLQEDQQHETEILRSLNQKPPLPKRSLNQWLEKSNKGPPRSPDADSEGAVNNSRDNIVEESSSENLQNESQFSNSLFSSLEEVGEPDKVSTQEVKVVKEKCSESDKDLFQTSQVSESFHNKLSDSQDNELVMESFESQDSAENVWLKLPRAKEELSVILEKSEDGTRSISSRARAWMSSMEKESLVTVPQDDTLQDNDIMKVHRRTFSNIVGESATRSGFSESKNENVIHQKPDLPQSMDPASSTGGTRMARKAAEFRYGVKSNDLNLRVQNNASAAKPYSHDTSLHNEQNRSPDEAPEITRCAEEMNSKSEHKDKNNADFDNSMMDRENEVIFHSIAMGIRLKRGEDGFVRVVSVTEATAGSSIVRDGAIEPDDVVMEAAGVDLRSPITNGQWGEVVTKIRKAPRPMKFIVAGKEKTEIAHNTQNRSNIESHVSGAKSKHLKSVNDVRSSTEHNSPDDQEMPELVAAFRSQEKASGIPSSITSSKADETAISSMDDEPNKSKDTPKESLFKRITSCTASSSRSTDHNGEANEVPLAHLAFLRTNPTIARVTNAASRRYPAFCGRPDTIFEEPDDAGRERKSFKTTDKSSSSNSQFINLDRSATSSTYGGSKSAKIPSPLSSGPGDNTAFLESLAMKSAVSSKPTRTRNIEVTSSANSQQLGRASFGSHSNKGNEVGWPDSDGPEYSKDTLDTMSAYSSNRSHSTFQSNRIKRDTARQAELLAAAKVEAMMDELQNVDPMDQCEI